MIPKEQKLYHFIQSENRLLELESQRWIDLGWIIHQVIPVNIYGSFYLLLYKY